MNKIIPNQYGKIFIPNVLNSIEIPIAKEVEENDQTNTEIVYGDTQILKNGNKILWNKDNINSYYLPLLISPIYSYRTGRLLPFTPSTNSNLNIGGGIYSSKFDFPSNLDGDIIYQYFFDRKNNFKFCTNRNDEWWTTFQTYLNNFINEYKNLINIENIWCTVQELTYDEYKNFMITDFYPNHYSIDELYNYGKTILKVKFPSLDRSFYSSSSTSSSSYYWKNDNWKNGVLISDNIQNNYLFTYIPINKNKYYFFNWLYKQPDGSKEYYFNPHASTLQVSNSSIYTINDTKFDLKLAVKDKGIIRDDPIALTSLWGSNQSQDNRILTIFSYNDEENNNSQIFPENIFKEYKLSSEGCKIISKELQIKITDSYGISENITYSNKQIYDNTKYPFYLVWNCQPTINFCRFVYTGFSRGNPSGRITPVNDYKNPYLIYNENNKPKIYQYQDALLGHMNDGLS